MENKNVILLTVVSIATLLTAVVGASFAYFSTTVTKDTNMGDKNQASVTTAKYTASTITFSSTGNKIEMTNAIPGDSKSTTFTIANTGNTDIKYNVSWTGVTSTFDAADTDNPTVPDDVNPQDNLKYSLVCVDSVTSDEVFRTGTAADANVVAPTGTNATANIKTAQTIGANKTHNCTLTVTFVETNAPQNYNQGRSFVGTIDVTTENITNQ